MNRPVSRDQMMALFSEACTPAEDLAVGMEWEKEAVRSSGHRVSFDEFEGVEYALRRIASLPGRKPHREGDHTIGVGWLDGDLTLEPGAQIELATPPRRRIAALEKDARGHLEELQSALGPEVLLLRTGFTPIQPVADIPFVPKGRYRVMRRYLAETGDLAHAMMKGTTSAQYAVDYRDEADCARKFAAVHALSPIVLAATANSPIANGVPAGDLSVRARAWLRTDPARTRIPDAVVNHFSFEAYLDWALSVPMMFVEHNGSWRDAGGVSFARWREEGLAGMRPGYDEYLLHLTAVFPDVRLKNFIEIRGADNGSLEEILAGAALWKGLLYDDGALDAALQIVAAVRTAGTRDNLLETAIKHGLAGRWGGRTLAAWFGDLVESAAMGLSARGAADETVYLEPLRARASTARSPAVDVLDAWESSSDVETFLRAIAYPGVESLPTIG